MCETTNNAINFLDIFDVFFSFFGYEHPYGQLLYWPLWPPLWPAPMLTAMTTPIDSPYTHCYDHHYSQPLYSPIRLSVYRGNYVSHPKPKSNIGINPKSPKVQLALIQKLNKCPKISKKFQKNSWKNIHLTTKNPQKWPPAIIFPQKCPQISIFF